MSHAYTEDQLVEQPAIGLFAALGWQTISALEETFGTAGTLGRETKSEVLLVERLRIALTKLGDSPHVFISVTAGRKPLVVSRIVVVVPDLRKAGFAGLGRAAHKPPFVLPSLQKVNEVLDLSQPLRGKLSDLVKQNAFGCVHWVALGRE